MKLRVGGHANAVVLHHIQRGEEAGGLTHHQPARTKTCIVACSTRSVS
jgi:hypothetical protein